MKFSDYLKSIQILSIALPLGVSLFLGISYYLVFTSGKFIKDEIQFKEIMMYILFFMGSVGFYLSHFIFQKKINQIQTSNETLKYKLTAFRSAHIVRLAMIEGPALLAIVCYLLFADQNLLLFAVASIGFMVYIIPSKSTLLRHIGESDVDNDIEVA
jgi:hypothetical protein